ncbi:MAG TPA: DUF533 domain-containing protein [Aquimonas sp.]|nr:DUF533 domain-containing protein [Aquimonas sp.]HRF53374.1 DUF533 domain-containing protein [Aquimonas sp.]
MFDAQRLLGQMLGSGMDGLLGGGQGKKRRRSDSLLGGLSTGTKAQLGLGIVGIAMAAFEHYQQQSKASAPVTPSAVVPPPPPMAPPVIPVPPTSPPPHMPTVDANSLPPEQAAALIMVRSMIAAAAADGLIDGDERERILQHARQAGFDADDQAVLDAELSRPLSIPELAGQTRPEQAIEVYAAAMLSMDVDTDKERAWLQRLGDALNLTAQQRQQIEQHMSGQSTEF